jgi:hypothetical protein
VLRCVALYVGGGAADLVRYICNWGWSLVGYGIWARDKGFGIGNDSISMF